MTDSALAIALARRIVAFRDEDITEHADEVARKCLVDTVGVTIAGASGPEVDIAAAVHGSGQGDAIALGRQEWFVPLDAALVNGTASHALDFDDFSGTLGGHQSAPVTSALLAIASTSPVTGRDLLTAYVVGCEVSILLATAVHPHHYDKGWHPTATLGVFGTAAASAKLLGLDVERTATALAIAASLASGIKANFGTMTKPLHVGLTARAGLTAALLASEGFTANTGAFEHHQGFFEVFNGSGRYDADGLVDRFASPLKLEEDSIVIKRYACCGSTHAAIDAARALVQRPGYDPSRIRSIRVGTPMQRLRHTDRPQPATALEGKFSVQYVVVRALLDGAVRVGDFDPARILQPEVTELLSRLTAHAVEPDAGVIGDWGAEVEVTLDDGSSLVETVRDVADRGGARQMPWHEVADKFRDCCRGRLEHGAVDRLLHGFTEVGGLQDVGRLLESARP